MNWYYLNDASEVVGPLSEETLRELHAIGRLAATTKVCREGSEDWTILAEALGTFTATPPPPPPTTPPQQSAGQPAKKEHSGTGMIQDMVCGISGLKPLQGFSVSYLLSNPFKYRSPSEVDSYFNCGCPQTTPQLVAVPHGWPRPWFFWRMLVFGFVILLAFVIGVQAFENANMLPGLMIVGAFFVPLACVALFFEFNVLRDISLYQVLKFIVCGGAVSLVIALLLFATTGLNETFLGATSAGIIEEVAKALAAVALLHGARHSKWILNGLLIGAAVGAGFAGFESAGYIFRAFFSDLAEQNDSLTHTYATLFVRALMSPFCHVIWTASVVGALWRVKRDQRFQFSMLLHKDFLRILGFVMALHMLWNSGLLWSSSRNIHYKARLILWSTSFIGSWYLAFLLVQEGLWQVRDATLAARKKIARADNNALRAKEAKADGAQPETPTAAS
jgi:RsiW-degrading membrane proteinase PrsW (M82 family)